MALCGPNGNTVLQFYLAILSPQGFPAPRPIPKIGNWLFGMFSNNLRCAHGPFRGHFGVTLG